MSDFDLPDLPSDKDLGIDDEDLEEFLEDEGSELTDAEMQALLGESPKPKPPPKKRSAQPGGEGTAAPAGAQSGKPKKKPGTKKAPWWARWRKPSAPKAAEPKPGAAAQSPAADTRTTQPKPATPAPETPKTEAPKTEKPPQPPRVEEPEGPRTKWRGPATLAFLVLAAWMSSSARSVPSPVPANAPDTAFSSARAMSHIVEIARAAHPPGSPEHDRVREYILDELRDLGLEPEVQTATSMLRGTTLVRAVTARNVLARIPGTDNTGAVLVTAHYDGRELARAAGDDGSGVVSILESLRALRGGEPLRNDLIVLITDAEELGLLGARAFVNDHPWMDDVQAVISIEMRGSGGPSIMFETGAEYGWITEVYKRAAPIPFANSLTYEIYKSMPNDTDFTPFREAGKQGLNFAAIGRAHVYHQVFDNPENLHEGTLQGHGLNTLSMIRALGQEDLATVNAPDVVYFSMPLMGLVIYPKGWVWPITGLVMLMWIAVLLVGRRPGIRPWGVVAGALLPLLAGAGAYFGAGWLAGWLQGFHPELGALHGSAFHSEGWYVMTAVAFGLALTTGLYGVARRWFTTQVLLPGAGMIVIIALGGITYFLPMGAHTVQWPAMAFMAAALAGASMPKSGRMGDVRWLVMLLLALPVLGMLTSLVELLWLVMSVQLLGALAVLVVFTLILLLPSLDALREPNSWWAPAAAVVVGGACLGVGLLQAAPSAERPLPSTLIYTLDRENGEAIWATQTSEGEEDAARAWAEAATSASFGVNRTLEEFGGRAVAYAVAPAPTVDAPPPHVALMTDSAADGQRLARVAVASAIGAELLIFDLPEGTEVLAVNGRAIPSSSRGGDPIETLPTRIEHWGRPDTMVTVDVRLPAADTVFAFTLVEHSLRPGELVGQEFFQRPADVTANIVRQSDRAMIRQSVVLPLSAVVTAPTAPSTTAEEAASAAGEAETTAPAIIEPAASILSDSTLVPDTIHPDTAGPGTVDPDTTELADTTVVPDTTMSTGGSPTLETTHR